MQTNTADVGGADISGSGSKPTEQLAPVSSQPTSVNRYRYIDDIEVARAMGLADERQRKAHLHTLDGKPLVGASTAKSIVGKGDQLYQWYADLAAVSALAFPVQDIRSDYEKCKAIQDRRERQKAAAALDKKYPNYAIARKAAIESRDSSAKTGTERHGVLEKYVEHCITENKGFPIFLLDDYWKDIRVFMEWAVKNVDTFHFTEVHGYNEPLWLGGIADIGLTLKDGRRLIGDHKSSREAHPDQFLQCALYDLILAHSGILDANGNQLGTWELADGYVIFPFRSEPFTPEFKWNVGDWRRGAEAVVTLYKLLEFNQ